MRASEASEASERASEPSRVDHNSQGHDMRNGQCNATTDFVSQFSTLIEKDSMGKHVGNTLFPAVKKSCLQQRHEYHAGRTEGMALKHADQPLETHETKTVSTVTKSRHLGCFRISFRVFLGCFRVFPGVSEGFRTKCIIQQK